MPNVPPRTRQPGPSRWKHRLLSLAVVTVPWALVLLPLAAQTPSAAALAISPASLLLMFVGLSSATTLALCSTLGALVLALLVAELTEERQALLLPIGYGVFFLALGLFALMRQ